MQACMDIHQNPNKLETIDYIKQKIPELAVHQGIKCASDNNYRYICIYENNMKKHWSQQHCNIRDKQNNKSKN